MLERRLPLPAGWPELRTGSLKTPPSVAEFVSALDSSFLVRSQISILRSCCTVRSSQRFSVLGFCIGPATMLFSRAARFAPRRALGLRATNPLGAAAASSGAPKDGSRGLEYEGLDPVMRERVKRRVAELSVASEGVAKPPSFSNNGSQQPGTNPEDPLLHRWERRGGHSVELASAADRRFEDIMGGTSETSPQDLDLQLASAHTPLSKVAKSSVDRPTAGGSHAGAATAPSLDDTASPAGARPGGNNAPNNGRRNSPLGSVYERRFNSPEQNTVGPEANPANPHDRRSNLSEDITAIDPEAVKIAQADIDPMKMAFVEETLKQELGGGLNFSSLARPFRPGAIGGSSFSARAKNSGGGGGGGLPVAFNNGAEAMKAGVSARGGVGSKALGSAASFELSESKKLLEESFWGGTMTAPLSVADVEANSDARLQEVAEASLRHVSKVASPSARTVDAAVGGAAGTDLNSLDRAFHGKSSNNSGNDSSLPPSAVKPPFRLAAIVGGGGGSSSGSGSKGGTTTTTTKAKRRIILGLNASVGEMSDGGDVLGPRHDDLVEEAEKEEVTEDEERALGPGRAGFDDTLTPEQLRTQEAYRESLRVLPPPGGWDDPVALYRSGAGVSLGGPGGSNTRRRGFHTSTKQHKGFFSLFSGRDNNNSDDKNKEQDEDDSNAASRPRRSQALPSFGDGRSHGVETGAGAAVFTQGSHPSSPSAEKRDAETPLEAVRFAEHDDDNTSSDDGSLSHHPGLERRTMMAAAEAEVDPGLEGWRPSGGQHSTAMKEEPKDEEEDESWVEARGGRRKTASASEPAVLEGEEGRQAFSLRESEAQQRQQLQSSVSREVLLSSRLLFPSAASLLSLLPVPLPVSLRVPL